jgi:hypothetical protein
MRAGDREARYSLRKGFYVGSSPTRPSDCAASIDVLAKGMHEAFETPRRFS